MDNKSNPLDGLVYRLVDDIEGNSFRLENNKGESLQLNLPDGLQFGEQITIPKAIKANERKHMKINTSRHKNEDNLSQDDWKGMYKFCGATFIFEEGEDR